ncbi:unnamed protein product [Rhizoctonia solani]|uniref:DUF7330 domain-containing protein n=1 Tax=Rhizoctonia solani TaxID=456999 RepID=A0A8H3BU40_9AGAM|nr:unnamed protein product [Rhizoctonia solani]
MIIPDSEKSPSSAHTSSPRSQTSFGPIDAPPSPPPYSATIASGDGLYQDESHSPQPAGFRTTSSTRPNLSPRCNYLIDRKTFSSVNGTWHIDTALEIPEHLLPPIIEFDGHWNREIQQARKARAKELRRHERPSNSRRNSFPPLVETRPNLMLGATNGAISGDIHVVSSDQLMRQATLVAEGCNGSINLRIHAPPGQLLRIFASSTNGSINIKIPPSFEGAVIVSTSLGSVMISESIKARFMTFSSTSNTSRGFIGDWKAQRFGTTTNPTDSPPIPGPRDPFATWTGPLIDISSTNGSVSLSYEGEDVTTAYAGQFTRSMKGLMNRWFGGVGQNGGVGSDRPPTPHPPNFHPPPPPVPPSSPPSPSYSTYVPLTTSIHVQSTSARRLVHIPKKPSEQRWDGWPWLGLIPGCVFFKVVFIW